MVTRMDAAELAALAFMQGFDGLTPGMWLQLQGLVKGREPLDPEQISILVRNILIGLVKKEGKMDAKLSHPTQILPTLGQSKPIAKELSTGRGGDLPTEKRTILPKIEISPEAKTLSPERPKEASKDLFSTQRPPLKRPGEELQSLKEPSRPQAEPIQQAVKEVVQALTYFPQNGEKKGIEAKVNPSQSQSETLIKPSKEMASTEFMMRDQSPPPEPIVEKKVAAKPHFQPFSQAPQKETSPPLQQRTVDLKEPQPKLDPVAHQKPAQPFVPLTKKELDTEQLQSSKTTAHAQPAVQTRTAERTLILGAPYISPSSASEFRRKEKKKYPHYFSDREEGEEDSENNDPNKK